MDIIVARLIAVSPASNPRAFEIPARPNADFILGRSNFSTGDDAIISRRHAKFTINSVGPETLVVQNLSLANGLLVNFTPVQPHQRKFLNSGDEICFCGAHGLTERIKEEELPVEADKYRYRVLIIRGTRKREAGNARKREREVYNDEHQSKRQREDVIELSSDGDEPMASTSQRPISGSGRRISPVSVGSSSDEGIEEEIEEGTYETSDEDLENTLVDDDGQYDTVKPGSTNMNIPRDLMASGATTASMDKGKEASVPPLIDLQEELECFICSMIMIVPHVCSPCGHGACGPCVYQWREKSELCPQCRVKLSVEEPFVRDYVLERIAERYAKMILTPEENLKREDSVTAFLELQRRKKEDEEKKAKESKFMSWPERARKLGLQIPISQQNYTAEVHIRDQNADPPGWNLTLPQAKEAFNHWRIECAQHFYRLGQRNTGSSIPPQQQRARNDVSGSGPRRAVRNSGHSETNTRRTSRAEPAFNSGPFPPVGVQMGEPVAPRSQPRFVIRQLPPQAKPDPPSQNRPTNNPHPQAFIFGQNQTRTRPPTQHINQVPVPTGPPEVRLPNAFDPDWIREVSQALGQQGLQQLQQEQFRAMRQQYQPQLPPPPPLPQQHHINPDNREHRIVPAHVRIPSHLTEEEFLIETGYYQR